jgi:hypothetical protein
MRIKWVQKYLSNTGLVKDLYVNRDDFNLYEFVPQNSINQWCYENQDVFKDDERFKLICELVDSKDLNNYIIAFELITNIPDGNNY